MAPPLLSLNGHPLSTAGLSWPRIGIWTADAVVSKAEPGDAGIVPWPPAEGAPATLVLGSRITLHGRIIKAGRQGEDYTVRVCGGKAGLGKRLKPKFYQGATAGDVLADLCSEVGETLSPLCTPKVLATALERWTRTEQIAGHHLYLVMAHLGVSWRTDEAGHVWVGDHAWEPLVVDASDIGVVGSRPTEDRLEFTSDEPFLRPGVVLDDFSGKGGGAFPTKGLRIARVRCAITADNTSTQAWVEPADARGAGVPPPPGAPPGDVLRGALHAIVRQTTAGVDYHALYPGKVVFQQQDGTLDIEVFAGAVLDAVVLRSYVIGAAHQALGWVRSEGIAVSVDGTVQDLTIRSFGILQARAVPQVRVRIIDDPEAPAVNGSDAVFAAVAAARWLADGLAPTWPVDRAGAGRR